MVEEATTEVTTDTVATPTDQDNGDSKTLLGSDTKPSETKDSGTTEKAALEKYELKLGKDSLLDEEHIENVSDFSRQHNFTNKQANELLARDQALVSDHMAKVNDDFEATVQDWRVSVEKDSEIGGEDFKKNLEMSKRALDRYGSTKLKEALHTSGLGNHPELIRVFMKIGQAMADDTFDPSGKPKQREREFGSLLYPALAAD